MQASTILKQTFTGSTIKNVGALNTFYTSS